MHTWPGQSLQIGWLLQLLIGLLEFMPLSLSGWLTMAAMG
jgi:hypothetical protein